MQAYKAIFQEPLMNRLYSYRKEQQLSQEKMAEFLHISLRSYIDLEHGKYCFSALSLIFFLTILPKDELHKLIDEFRVLIEKEDSADMYEDKEPKS